MIYVMSRENKDIPLDFLENTKNSVMTSPPLLICFSLLHIFLIWND